MFLSNKIPNIYFLFISLYSKKNIFYFLFFYKYFYIYFIIYNFSKLPIKSSIKQPCGKLNSL